MALFSWWVALGRRIGLYKYCKDIGRGNFSKVKLAIHQLTRDSVAIKVVDRGRLDARALRMLSREVITLECVHHPNVLRLFEVVETLSRVHLVTEFISGGELYHRITNDGPIKEPQAIVLYKQLLSAVKHMHSLGFVHRDIKAENVLLVSEDKIKLADFGFSTKLLNGAQHLDTFCGSPPYAAPELFSDDHYIGGPVDVWALGVLLYFMVVGNMPFRAPTVSALRAAVLKGDFVLPGHLSLPCTRLIQRILVHMPSRRPTIDQMQLSQWLNIITVKPLSESANSQTKKSSFWLIKNRSIRSSRCSKEPIIDTKNLVPIQCTTKRGGSVLVDNFLHPIEISPKEENETEVVPVLPSTRRSFFGGNSKKKIGPMDTEKRESGKMFNRNSIEISSGTLSDDLVTLKKHTTSTISVIESKSSSITTAGDKITSFSATSTNSTTTNTITIFDEEEGDFIMVPTCTYDLTHLHPLEIEARRILDNLGITAEMLLRSIASGPRSDVIGAYRIIINRLQNQILLAKLKGALAKDEAATAMGSRKSKEHTRSCVIL